MYIDACKIKSFVYAVIFIHWYCDTPVLLLEINATKPLFLSRLVLTIASFSRFSIQNRWKAGLVQIFLLLHIFSTNCAEMAKY